MSPLCEMPAAGVGCGRAPFGGKPAGAGFGGWEGKGKGKGMAMGLKGGMGPGKCPGGPVVLAGPIGSIEALRRGRKVL